MIPVKCAVAALISACFLPAAYPAEAAHVHGLLRINVALDKQRLTVQLESPLDGLLGFEHRPKTPTQQQAADVLGKQLSDGAALFKPDAAAQRRLTKATVESAVLQAPSDADASRSANDAAHADLDADYEFTCAKPDQLTAIEIGLFDAFPRVQRIEVQVAGPKKQSKATLRRPEKLIGLKR